MHATATQSSVSDPETCPQVPAEPEEKRVPDEALLWGFVRRTANDKDDSAVLRETDIRLWLDEKRYRFLVAAGPLVKDDLAPLEFVQFIRELKHSTSQTLFKLGNSFVRSPRRATPVWSRPVATVIHFPSKFRSRVTGTATQDRTETQRTHRKSDGAVVMQPAVRRMSARSPGSRIGNAASARFS
jgi:hypothetical protein